MHDSFRKKREKLKEKSKNVKGNKNDCRREIYADNFD